MNDVELTRALERGDIPNESFHHAKHLEVAWIYLSESASSALAAEQMGATLRRFAGSVGKPEKYHETITRFWIAILSVLRDSEPAHELRRILVDNPWLLEKTLPLKYYSHQTLWSDRARNSWVEPDLQPLPANATALRSSYPTCDTSHRAVSEPTG